MAGLGRAARDGLAAAVVAALLSLAVTRPLMRAAALLSNDPPSFSAVGTAGILLVYVGLLLPGCVALAWSRARWPWLLFAAGGALLLFQAAAIGRGQVQDSHDMTAGRWSALSVVLLLMAATYAAQLVLGAATARGWRPGRFKSHQPA